MTEGRQREEVEVRGGLKEGRRKTGAEGSRGEWREGKKGRGESVFQVRCLQLRV